MANSKGWVGLLVFLVAGLAAQAQDRYAVYFKYKPQSEYSLAKPSEFLTQKALDRRTKEGIPADSLDLPVSKKYLDEIKELAEQVLFTSNWLNAAVFVADKSKLEAITQLPFVVKVELVAHDFLEQPMVGIASSLLHTKTTEADRQIKLNTRELAIAENSYDFQNQLIGIDKMHEEGITGKGVTIAVFDAGFPGTNTASALAHLMSNKQLIGQLDLVRPWNTEVFSGNQHGTNVLSLIAANEPSKLVSGAYDSDFILVITEQVETEYRIEEYNWLRAAEYSDSLGVDIISSSVGYLDFDDVTMTYSIEDLDGKTAVITLAASIASDKGILVINSVGNYGASGASSLLAPADANNIVSVGSVKTNGEMSSFSSQGPTADGRFKPELAAFGDNPILIRSNGTVGSSNGTSFSAPQIAALAAGLWQAKPEWTKSELMENLFRSATQYESADNLLGYGVPNFYDALYGEVLGVKKEEPIEWKVYPNPLLADELNLHFGLGLRSDFELVDLSGKVLIQTELSRSSAKVPFRVQLLGIKPGLYLVVMQDDNSIRQSKLLRR